MTLLGDSSFPKIRPGTPGDFNIKSEEGDLVSVHTTVLKPLWSFFSSALQATFEVIVRFFYDQDLNMNYSDAANFVVVAPMYDIPDPLLQQAIRFIEDRDMTVKEKLTVWKRVWRPKTSL